MKKLKVQVVLALCMLFFATIGGAIKTEAASKALTDKEITAAVKAYIAEVETWMKDNKVEKAFWNKDIDFKNVKDVLNTSVGDTLSPKPCSCKRYSHDHSKIQYSGCLSNSFRGPRAIATEKVTGNQKGWQCSGFADYMAAFVFRDVENWVVNKTVDDDYVFRPGDIIRTDNHSYFIYESDTDSVKIIECNMPLELTKDDEVKAKYNCVIGWKNTVKQKDLRTKFKNNKNYVLFSPPSTLRYEYREEDCTHSEYDKGICGGCGKVCSHTEYDKYLCKECKTEFPSNNKKETNVEGKYKVITEGALKERPYSDPTGEMVKTITGLEKDDIIQVKYSVENSQKNVWYYTNNYKGCAGYIYSGDVKKATWWDIFTNWVGSKFAGNDSEQPKTTTPQTNETQTNQAEAHTHEWSDAYYEEVHPHNAIRKCKECGETEYLKENQMVENCTECYPEIPSYKEWKINTPAWANTAMGNVKIKDTSGLVVALSMAIVDSGMVSESEFTPADMADFLKQVGAITGEGGIYWTKVDDAVPGFVEATNVEMKESAFTIAHKIEAIKLLIEQGYQVIVQIPGKKLQYVTVDRVENGVVYMFDPCSDNVDLFGTYGNVPNVAIPYDYPGREATATNTTPQPIYTEPPKDDYIPTPPPSEKPKEPTETPHIHCLEQITEAAHPHKVYNKCSECGYQAVLHEATDRADCTTCHPPVTYAQWKKYDSNWSGTAIGSKTVGNSSGLPVALAIAMVDCGIKSADDFNPNTLVSLMNNCGGFNSKGEVVWSKVDDAVPGFVEAKNTNMKDSNLTQNDKYDMIKKLVDQGYVVVLQIVKPELRYVVVDRIENGVIYMFDPNSENTDLFATYGNGMNVAIPYDYPGR